MQNTALRALVAFVSGFVTVPPALAQMAGAAGPSDGIAFVRVSGDVHLDVTQDWEGPETLENVEIATGSGFVIAPSGLVLTNQHVVSDERTFEVVQGREVEVSVEVRRIEVAVGAGGRHGTYEAWVAASDAELDLAVLQVTGPELPFIALGDSDAIEAGRPVKVLGFPFGRQVEVGRTAAAGVVPRPSVTAGSLSAVRSDDEGRTRYLQTDASVNPGSSGGPILNEDGDVIGVVRMKLARDEGAEGAGFGVPVNLVKDFLESHGLLSLVPGERLRAGVRHELDWKGLRIDLPEGFVDTAPGRLRVDCGADAGPVTVRVDRIATPLGPAELEEALLAGRGLSDFAPGRARPRRRDRRGDPPRLVGSATGLSADGSPFRVEYALLDLGREQIVARYVGSPLDVAFNLGLLRRSLETLVAVPLLTDELRRPPDVDFERTPGPGLGSGLLMPSGWSLEESEISSCRSAPRPDAGLAASPPGDFTVVFRALSWDRRDHPVAELVRACGAGPGTVGPTFARGGRRLGVGLAFWGVLLERGREVVVLEAEAPEPKLRLVQEAFVTWVNRVAGESGARYP